MAGSASWLRNIDELLRGEKTREAAAARDTRNIRLVPFLISAAVLGLVYGIFMGLYAVLTRDPPCWEQLLATALKVPALFLLTLFVTFPSLYVFSALLGTRLRFIDTLRVLVSAVAVTLCVLAAFGPITGFFTISTTSYPFMKLLNVLFFAIAGFLGLGFLVRVLRAFEYAWQAPAASAAPAASEAAPSPAEPAEGPGPSAAVSAGAASRHRATPPPQGAGSGRVLTIWLLVYAFVGAQMGWILRPFIGSPAQPFEWFRERRANIFIDIVRSIKDLFS